MRARDNRNLYLGLFAVMKPTRIILHTYAFKGSADIDEVKRWHLLRGFNDVGYHYCIRRSGERQIGRKETVMGAHCRGQNRDSIGIAFEGHGDFEAWTPEQVTEWLKLYDEIYERWGIEPKNVYGHNEFDKNKTCPGKLINMDSVRLELIKQRNRIDLAEMPKINL